jgi:hypothetical protein
MNENDTPKTEADGSVERRVRPTAWVRNFEPQPHCVTDLRYCAASDVASGKHLQYLPLYTQAALDAAVAAERERGDSLRSQTLDLALMVGRLIRRMRAARAGKGVAASDEELERKCLDYLRRKGLTSPLRQEPPSGGDMTAILDVKRREWETLSPEAQAKLRAMTGHPGPEYRRQQALGAERARKVPLGGA